MIVFPVIRLFNPHFAISHSLIELLEKRKTTKKYLITHNTISLVLGVVLICAIIIEEFKLIYVLLVLMIVFSCVLICNKLFIGQFWAFVPKSHKKG